jgi:hypothetical protein
MTLLLTKNWFPPDQGSKVAKRYVDWLKDHPPDKTIEKVFFIGVSSEENGMVLAFSVSDIMKGKEKEALLAVTEQNLFMASGIEGFRYKAEIILNYTEAYKILGMTAPEV